MDEFQEVARFDGFLFNTFKKPLDENPSVRYFFSGSSLQLPSSMLLREDAPSYMMVGCHFMEPLWEEDVTQFVVSRLGTAGVSCERHAAQTVFAKCGGIPFYVQKLGLLLAQGASGEGWQNASMGYAQRGTHEAVVLSSDSSTPGRDDGLGPDVRAPGAGSGAELPDAGD